jgi:uncharacterized membrane protein YdjX (TVP38/TMEM64 family)
LKETPTPRAPQKRRLFAIIGFPLFFAALVAIVVIFRDDLWRIFTSVKKLEEWVRASGPVAPLVFIAVQVFHVIVFVIPGEVVQIAGGYLFGIWPGTLYSVAGILIGSPVDFYLARFLGVPFVNALFPPERVEKTRALLGSRGSKVVFFFLFLIPGIPKDFLCYVAGLTPIRFRFFIVASMVGRLPGIIGSSLVGNSAAEQRWFLSVAIFGGAAIISVAALLLRGRIDTWLRQLGSRGERE